MKSNRRSGPGRWPVLKRCTIRPPLSKDGPVSLLLPVNIPSKLFDLSDVALTANACRQHFAELELEWTFERKGSFGRARTHSVLSFNPLTGDIWTLVILEAASAGRHAHNGGGPYGEFIVTLAGELDDLRDDGCPVELTAGMVLFHAPGTVHEARATKFWVGLIHQPCGCTEVM